MRDPRYRGIEKHGNGWRAVVSQGRTHPRVLKYFPAGTPPAEMQRWRADTKAEARVSRKRRASRGTFEGDARRYLKLVSAMPDIDNRTREIELWIGVFGTRDRDAITAGEIRAQRDLWATTPRKGKRSKPVSANTINRRLRALSNLFRTLDGTRAENPVRDVPELPEPEPRQRTLTHADIRRVIAALSDQGNAPRAGAKRVKYSPTKIRIRCLAFCQITPKQLTQLTPQDLDLIGKRLHLPARAKGKGARAIWTDLLPEAVHAFSDFHRHELYGAFDQRAVSRAWRRAARKLGIDARLYDTRHAFGALVYRATKSRDAVSTLLQHATWSTSAIYAKEAEDDVRAQHTKAVVEHFRATTKPH